ncbi:histidine kinase [Actinomadura sp. ATCC 31491]|uniref:histidine kinase n=1 Tax=Actinomadura luzonensis TaxID=2805427 RepID=A0ABT0FRC3_9ACTN|nr:histidine kinase [Actinomadura luzonensis]MCK2214864.1 histidine kinase [Actinomadura luzonensis]
MRFVLLGAAVSALSLPVLQGQAGAPSGLPLPAAVAVAAAAGAAAWWARRSWWPLAALGAAAYVWFLLWPPLLAASYFAGRDLAKGRDSAAYLGGCAAVCGASALVGAWRAGPQEMLAATPGNALFLAVAVIGLPFALGLWTRARHEVRRRAEREQVMRAEQARAQERARIAREMHDVVAHRVSLIVLHAGALEVRTADEAAARAAALIGGIGREALADLRDVLGVLRSPEPAAAVSAPLPTLGDLDRLLDQSRALGIEVVRRDEGEARAVEPAVGRTAYRVVQEALTNVHKHAADARTDVRVRYRPEALEVEVRNGPPPAAPAGLPGAGWGLVGLRERVELLGGTLRTCAEDGGGFLVAARIPA